MKDDKKRGKELLYQRIFRESGTYNFITINRMTLTSRIVKTLESACAEIMFRAKN